MKKSFFIIMAILIVIAANLPKCASSISTADAIEAIDVDKKSSLEVNYVYDDLVLNNSSMYVYHVADIDTSFQYHLTDDFSKYPILLDNIKSQEEWEETRQTLESYVRADHIAPIIESKIANNLVVLPDLANGLYLVMNDKIETTDYVLEFQNFLLNLPFLEEDGRWNYSVSIKPKAFDYKVRDLYKVVKVWNDKDTKNRPNQVSVDIYCNDDLVESQFLSKDNNWQYEWKTEGSPSDVWTVVERNIPEGYTVKIVGKENIFIITNTNLKTPDTGFNFKNISSATVGSAGIVVFAVIAFSVYLIFKNGKNIKKQ